MSTEKDVPLPLPPSPPPSDQFTPEEKRNIGFFIAGLMCYKFAFESLGGSVNQFVLTRIPGVTTLSLLIIFYGLAQSFGSMLVSQLVRIFRASKVISFFIGIFASLGLVYILIEAFTGGTLDHEGSWNPYGIFPIYICMGGCLGVMELVRRVIPSNIVGTHPEKLKKMDATVHIFYEIAGTSGAFASSPMLKFLGPVYATFLIPPLFLTGAFLYWKVQHDGPVPIDIPIEITDEKKNKLQSVVEASRQGMMNYFASVFYGARIVLYNRQYVWLIFGYVLPLVLHRLVENLLFSLFAKNILHDGSLSQILLGGSNFGELCGAALVLRFSQYIKSPLPWVRIDAIALSVLWVLPYASSSHAVLLACGLIPVMMILSGAWAAGDVSLLAYIQAHLPEEEDEKSKISPIGAVMGFLYASYTIISTLLIYGLGRAFDYYIDHGDVREGFFWVSGVGISFAGVLIFTSTFVPKGSWALNPDLITKPYEPEIELDDSAKLEANFKELKGKEREGEEQKEEKEGSFGYEESSLPPSLASSSATLMPPAQNEEDNKGTGADERV